MIEPWRRIEPTTITKVGWRTIETKTFVLPDKRVVEYDIFNEPNCNYVAVIAFTPKYKVILASMFRPGPEKVMHELPGGGVDVGETIQDAVLRELLEETGYTSTNLEYLGEISRDGVSNSRHHYFIAYDCIIHPDGPTEDPFQIMEVTIVTPAQLIAAAKEDALTDPAAILLAYDKLMQLAAEQERRAIIT